MVTGGAVHLGEIHGTGLLGRGRGVGREQRHGLAEGRGGADDDQLGLFEFAVLGPEELPRFRVLFREQLPVPRHHVAEGADLETRQRRVTCGVHQVGDDLVLRAAADVARPAHLDAPGRVPQVGHAVLVLLHLAVLVAPGVVIDAAVRVHPFLVGAVAADAADAVGNGETLRVRRVRPLLDGNVDARDAVTTQALRLLPWVVPQQLGHAFGPRVLLRVQDVISVLVLVLAKPRVRLPAKANRWRPAPLARPAHDSRRTH